ncbi:MAG: LmbE family N-acetylglucosaminyl deacetylase [bacterium]|jgi:LmbE family N-acetylglucosaminyl deacetylase
MKLKVPLVGFLLIILGNYSTVLAQETSSASEIVDQLKSLANTTKVLYIAAHPDDENTRLISYLTTHEHADVSYLSLTRGDGGQNLIGTEIGENLGVLRTQELLAARRIDGGSQFFTRAIDFGYSKTPEETFNFWDKEEILSDVVWIIRNVRPDIIITRFSPEVNPDRSTHGHHTASAMLALEAFDVAADPTRFPEQLEQVDPWQASSIFWNTSYWFYGSVEKMDQQVAKAPNEYVKVDVNQYLPLLGKTGSDISSLSRSQHKSQGFGNSPVIGSQWEYLQILKGSIKEDIFSSTYKNKEMSSKLDKQIQKVIKAFDIHHPEKVVPALFDIRDEIAQLADDLSRKEKLRQIHALILKCAGIKATAFTNDQLVYVGQEIESTIRISSNVQVDFKSINSKWLGGTISKTLSGTSTHAEQKILWKVPEIEISQPYWLKGAKQPGMYSTDNQKEIGLPDLPYPFQLAVMLEIDGRTISMNLPLLHGSTDPVKGEIIQPLVVTPNVMINLGKDVVVYTSEKPKTVSVEVIAGMPRVAGYIEIFLPEGWKSEPAFYKTTFKEKGEKQVFEFTVTPSKGESSGVLRAIFKDDVSVYSLGFYRFNYDHIPELSVFPSAEAKVVKVKLEKKGENVGYVMGAGDKVPQALVEMGYAVTELTVDDILTTTLNRFDAIVFGIRVLNTIEKIGSINEKMSNYAKEGGTVVMQYNTAHRLKSQPIGPYSITVSRDRVTEENAVVEIISNDHPVVNIPNKITEDDFLGWVQERGLYFPNAWDEAMTPILSMHDTNETSKEGSLLVGAYGQGYIVYCGLSFFRELPAGVPGAYRLLANILSL